MTPLQGPNTDTISIVGVTRGGERRPDTPPPRLARILSHRVDVRSVIGPSKIRRTAMRPHLPQRQTPTPSERALLDSVLQRYIDWREQAASVQTAYENSRDATAADCIGAFAVYTAALDREELASQLYADLYARATRVLRASRRVFSASEPTHGDDLLSD